MYSPKIKEDLIPILYQMAKTHKKPMTEVVDDMLRNALQNTGAIHQSKTTNQKQEENHV